MSQGYRNQGVTGRSSGILQRSEPERAGVTIASGR